MFAAILLLINNILMIRNVIMTNSKINQPVKTSKSKQLIAELIKRVQRLQEAQKKFST
jgi:hypothetical protein